MSHWGNSDSGILRKNKADENLDDLLVFGYSCKIFRDDEKALYVDQGKHLIPWMGDETLKIDRYDGRGTLSDLRQYEASREGYDALRWMGLSENEKKLEELCDSERYYSLEINEEEEEMYKEEIAKRQRTNAIGFNYDNNESKEVESSEGIPTVPEKEEEDEPYKPSPVLDVPVDINIPQKMKEYARIEKTALFVCRQGPQMEILIKAKQADNPQFSFLTVNDPLYKFYRHVLSAFKNGRYQPQCDRKPGESECEQQNQDEENSHYLHPSLLSTSTKSATPPLPKNPPAFNVPYRPSADCAYSQLVNRIQGSGFGAAGQSDQSTNAVSAAQTQHGTAISQMTIEQQYHQYYYVQQFYEYWRHAVLAGEQGALYASLPTEFSQLDPNMQSYIHQMAWAQFVQQYQKQMQEAQVAQAKANNNSYAQIVSNLNKDTVNHYTANVPQLPPPEPKTEVPKLVAVEVKNTEERIVTIVPSKDSEVKKPLLSLAAAYGSGTDSDSASSDSESDSENCEGDRIEVYRVPEGEAKTVIDKMAEYVFKNGTAFEDIIKEKGDPRFDFLTEQHEFNKYYRAKLRELRGESEQEVKKKVEKKSPKPKKVIAPVSFSIKKPKDDVPKEIKSALPMEDSSDEECQPDVASGSPQNNTLVKSTTTTTTNNNSNVTAQKISAVPKTSPTIYRLSTLVVPQPKVGQLLTEESCKSDSNAEVRLISRRSVSPQSHSRSKVEPSSSKKSSRSPTPSRRRSNTPRKRSVSPRRSPPKRSKSRSKTPGKTSPVRSRRSSSKKRSPVKSKLSPLRESDSQTKRKEAPIIDMFDVGETNGKDVEKPMNGILEKDDPILEMLELEKQEQTAEEKEADEKEKARQLERKRKAAMFLKLKSVGDSTTSVTEKRALPSEHTDPSSSPKTCKVSTRSVSRSESEESVQIISSRSSSMEKSISKEKSIPRGKSRSRSKSSRSGRRSRSKDRRESKKRRKSRDRDQSRSRNGDSDRRVRKEKKKKSHKRKHSKSKDRDSKSRKKSKKHKHSRSRSRTPTKSRSRVKSVSRSRSTRSRSVQSHISIDSS